MVMRVALRMSPGALAPGRAILVLSVAILILSVQECVLARLPPRAAATPHATNRRRGTPTRSFDTLKISISLTTLKISITTLKISISLTTLKISLSLTPLKISIATLKISISLKLAWMHLS